MLLFLSLKFLTHLKFIAYRLHEYNNEFVTVFPIHETAETALASVILINIVYTL